MCGTNRLVLPKTILRLNAVLEFCGNTEFDDEEVVASYDGIAFKVDFELFGVQVLSNQTNGTFELICGRAEKICKDIRVFILSASTARFFFDEQLSDELLQGSNLARQRTIF